MRLEDIEQPEKAAAPADCDRDRSPHSPQSRGIDKMYNVLNPVMVVLGILFSPEVPDQKREAVLAAGGSGRDRREMKR